LRGALRDEAIQFAAPFLDCFVASLLAMTAYAAKNAQKRKPAVDNVMTPL
jgi:hypothetical protein